ncbi:MAG: hypothetical protein JWL96_1248 [Sphingomonas bacterium]|uniref:hypothetical protein n=1 Tax=Sphingomonas bacterium TaxID=1895847 RepID=UPI00260C510B|nr:hypothetical protein [Sphingomonas bacterium]MDB5709178.1 hypothetical protein [Sphingomonas bacterium]
MTKTLFASAALLLAAAIPAFADEAPAQVSFKRDGETYVYTKVQKADRVILTGHRYPSGVAFDLTVRGDWVTGISDGVPVSFTMPNAQAKVNLSPEVAAR